MNGLKPKVATIILNWNNYNDTKHCIESVLTNTYSQNTIILVDNNSNDGSGERLHQEYSGLVFIPLEKNYGYGGGNNRGISWALENEIDYIFIINNDTFVNSDVVEKLVSYMEENQSISVVGPLSVYSSNTLKIQSAGMSFSEWGVRTKQLYFKEDVSALKDNIDRLDSVNGVGIFARSSIFREVGLFDESFFMYVEEVEWCYRVRSADKKIGLVVDAIIEHKIDEDNGVSVFAAEHISRGRVIFTRKHGTILHHIVLFFYTLYQSISQLNKSNDKAQAILIGYIRGYQSKSI